MSTGTGLVLFGVWIACAAALHSKERSSIALMAPVAVGMTMIIFCVTALSKNLRLLD